MGYPVRLLVVALLTVLAAASARAAERANLRVGYIELPPYSFTDAGRASGLAIAIIEGFAQAEGLEPRFVPFDNPGELLDGLSAGEVDATSLMALTAARAPASIATRPVGTFSTELAFAHPAPPGALEGNLEGLRVAVSRGSFPETLLRRIPGVEIVYFDTYEERLVALLSDRADAAVTPGRALQYYAEGAGLASRLSIRQAVLRSVPNGFLVHPGRPDLAAALDRHIGAMRANGRLASLEREWLAPVPSTLRDFILRNLTPIALTVGAVVLLLGGSTVYEAGRLRLRKREAVRTGTLLDAFDLASVGLVIYDSDLRAEISNRAFDKAFPGLVAGIRAGCTLPEMMRLAGANGYFGARLDETELAARVETAIATLRRGESFESVVYSAEGRIFARRGIALSDGRVAIVMLDVNELEESRRKLAEHSTRTKLANERLEAFARVAAHDLKSPAGSAATLLDWIAEDLAATGGGVPDTIWDAIDRARALLRRQVTLIDDLLAYARSAETGGGVAAFDPAQRVPIILGLVDIPEGFDVRVEGELPSIRVDRAAFDLTIRNLVSNAIKHHHRDTGRIRIRGAAAGSVAFFEVEDDGPGVPPDFAERVFEPFFKLRPHEEVEGSGLGLAMLRNTVTAWGGEIGLVPGAAASGTIVRFTAPLAEPAGDAPPALSSQGAARKVA